MLSEDSTLQLEHFTVHHTVKGAGAKSKYHKQDISAAMGCQLLIAHKVLQPLVDHPDNCYIINTTQSKFIGQQKSKGVPDAGNWTLLDSADISMTTLFEELTKRYCQLPLYAAHICSDAQSSISMHSALQQHMPPVLAYVQHVTRVLCILSATHVPCPYIGLLACMLAWAGSPSAQKGSARALLCWQ